MDPVEAMKRLRDSMIEISDLVGLYLTHGGSSLTKAQIEQAVASAEKVVEHGEDLIEWLGKSTFLPGAR
jgi:hypothetical protein